MAAAQSAKHELICSNCEEMVASNAARCPYCQYDLSAPFATRTPQREAPQIIPLNPKITHLEQPLPREVEQPKAEAAPAPEEEHSIWNVLVPLVSLLSGTFFVVFSLILKFFSKGGRLTLEWNASSFPVYFFPALFLLVLGLFSLSFADKE
jgi:hypothetical protein